MLVIDNTNILAKDAERILEILQRGAKEGIDSKLFVAVFTSSDGLAQDQIASKCFHFLGAFLMMFLSRPKCFQSRKIISSRRLG